MLTVSDTRGLADDRSGDALVERLTGAGHILADRAIVTDDTQVLVGKLHAWIEDPEVDCILTTGGTGVTGRDVTPEALARVCDKDIPGFGELFRWLSYAKIGTSTIQSRACAGVARGTYIFALPGSTGAVIDGWDGILASQLDIRHKPESDGKKIRPIEKFGLKTMSIGFLVKEDEAMIWRGPMVQSALTQMLNDVAWAPLDVLVLDMPPGTGDAQLTIAQRVPLKGAVIVSTPQDIALIDARKGIAMFNKTQVPILGMVENMSMFVCPDCGSSHAIFGHGGARETAEKLGAPFLGEIPLVPRIRETSDSGQPISVSAPDSAEAKAFLELAKKVAESLETVSRPAPKIVIE